MKYRNIVIAVCNCYLLITAHAQEIPTTLPIGGNPADYIAQKSPCTVQIILQGINSTGGISIAGTISNGLAFSSYNNLMGYIDEQASRQFLFLRNECTNIQLHAVVTYEDMDMQGAVILQTGVDLTLDLNGQTTAPLNLQNAQTSIPQNIFIPVAGLQSAVIQIDTNEPVSLSTVGTNGFMVSTNLFNVSTRTRIQITLSDGSQVTYTQTGARITPSMLYTESIPLPPTFDYNIETNWYTMSASWYDWYYQYYDNGYSVCYPFYSYTLYPNVGIDYNTLHNGYYYGNYAFMYWQPGAVPALYAPLNVLVDRPSGTDLLLQGSTNLVDWTTMAIVPWDSSVTHLMFPVDGYYVSGNFFRTIAY